ncbi:MAG TPA: hypothetical protein VNJ50_06900, partial [Gelidibacter sp.]|uniref:hypothetical protein n=1 Tax=Gelidibacter sp. TaxID=2018083 RepID=UPI002C092C42
VTKGFFVLIISWCFLDTNCTNYTDDIDIVLCASAAWLALFHGDARSFWTRIARITLMALILFSAPLRLCEHYFTECLHFNFQLQLMALECLSMLL